MSTNTGANIPGMGDPMETITAATMSLLSEPTPQDGTTVPMPFMEGRFLGAISTFKAAEPLGDSNWVAWKGQIIPMLELNQVWDHCEGDTNPMPEKSDPKYKQWMVAEQVAKVILTLNIKNSQFVHISQAASMKQMWENLTAVHQS